MRPTRSEDLEQMLQLAQLTGFGLSTLPEDAEYLEERIVASMRGFEHISQKPHGETYLMVMEDTDHGKVIGTSGIISKVGGFEPFYAYRVETDVLTSEHLDVRKEIEVLNLVTEHDGPCEIGSLFLVPGYQGQNLGRLLTRSRYHFMAEYPEHFEEKVIAELRGVVDEKGRSPFWEGLGRHFFDIDFPKADHMSMKNKTFIADLMPKHPIYVPLLSPAAQAVIGKVHTQSVPALRLLESQGFTRTGMVDIFEAGPILSCPRDKINTIKACRRGTVREIVGEPPRDPAFVISNTTRDYRACLGWVEAEGDDVRLDTQTADALHVSEGDAVRYSPSGKF